MTGFRTIIDGEAAAGSMNETVASIATDELPASNGSAAYSFAVESAPKDSATGTR